MCLTQVKLDVHTASNNHHTLFSMMLFLIDILVYITFIDTQRESTVLHYNGSLQIPVSLPTKRITCAASFSIITARLHLSF